VKVTKELLVDRRYVAIPVRNGAPMVHVAFRSGGRWVRGFDVELSTATEADFWGASEVSAWAGQRLLIEADGDGLAAGSLDSLLLSDDLVGAEDLYRERYRPQFHFSTRRGWNNDPNGLVWYAGEYHLFYQHNPYGWKWGNMHWGHAVSSDLVRWEELPEALEPDESGTVFSGSAVVDEKDTAGFNTGREKALVCIFTAAGGTSPESKGTPFTQSIAYSVDHGRQWKRYEGNPVLGHLIAQNRDPKVVRHESTGRWIMALFLDGNEYALFGSPDLKIWERTCTIAIPGASECPDFFELPVDGDARDRKWVLWAANGSYLVGSFDGREFVPEGSVQRLSYGASYAAQTWSDVPRGDGRRIQVAWLRGDKPGMPFNQQMGFPLALALRRRGSSVLLAAEPVREIEGLYRRTWAREGITLRPGDDLFAGTSADLLDVSVELEPEEARRVSITALGIPVSFDAGAAELALGDARAPLALGGEPLRLRLLIDRSSVEVFAQDGFLTLSHGAAAADGVTPLSLTAGAGHARIASVGVRELASIHGAPTAR